MWMRVSSHGLPVPKKYLHDFRCKNRGHHCHRRHQARELYNIRLEKDIQAEFKKFDIMEGVAVLRDQRGVVISIGDTLLFDSGSSEVRREARPLLATIASLIRKYQRSIIIEGHTDNIPLRGSKYSSNLELSSARASRTFQFLSEEEAVRPEGMSAAGYGEYRPVASNATVEGRARNRRVDIIFAAKKDET